MARSDITIRAEGLTKRFGNLVAVDDVSFTVRQGEVFGLLGPNGAGKSTTIRMLCGILKPTAGYAEIAGINVVKTPEQVKRTIGYMSQRFGLYDDLTVRENILFYARLYIGNWKKAAERANEVMEKLELHSYANTTAGQLSGGWRQRLALACAITHKPPVLFLDEPTAGVDPLSRRMFWDILYDMAAEGVTLFVTTHYMEEAERCDTIGFLWHGKLAALGSPEKIKKTSIPAGVYTIKGVSPAEVVNTLKGLPFVAETSQYGSEVHVITNIPEDVTHKIREQLMAMGLNQARVAPSVPSIEDVFMYISHEKANNIKQNE